MPMLLVESMTLPPSPSFVISRLQRMELCLKFMLFAKGLSANMQHKSLTLVFVLQNSYKQEYMPLRKR